MSQAIEVAAQVKIIPTNGKYSLDVVEVCYQGVTLQVSFQTGNWHPEGRAWSAVVRAPRHLFTNPGCWSYGLSDWGASADEAIINAWAFAKRESLVYPQGWLQEVMIGYQSTL